jgi:hypothetical protein
MRSLTQSGPEIIVFLRRQPWKTMGIILGVFVLLAAGNYALHTSFPPRTFDTPLWFSLPQSPGLDFHAAGLPYAAAFVVILLWAASRRAIRFGVLEAWVIGLVLILVGNLIQGNVDLAFRQPLIAGHFQYYDDALKINSWVAWLANFNADQTHLTLHGQTHPPFAVLFEYASLRVLENRPLRMAAEVVFLASLSVPLVSAIVREGGAERRVANRLAVLFAAIPAINIYTAVSLDGIMLTTCAMFLLGMLMLMRRERFSPGGFALFAGGILLTNLLTFPGIFALAVAAVMSLVEVLTRRSLRLLTSTVAAAALLGLVLYALFVFAGYNHVEAFLTASRIENPEGFRALSDPVNYFLTRLECVGELAFFLSIGGLAWFFGSEAKDRATRPASSPAERVGLIGIGLLGLMYLTGFNRVGETARTSMFIYPFVVLLLAQISETRVRDLTILAGIQTLLMQLLSSYFW